MYRFSHEDDDPTDPSHPDFDLSEASPYSAYEPRPKPWYLRRVTLLLVSLLVVFSLLLPYVLRL
ncbi:MAG TPA: hypothetical protein VNN21_09775 [Dehalococcoidia bacterium]|jgi:hypothetical protein|nr:hypothetical protein [Dehalococcoidia bacterium]